MVVAPLLLPSSRFSSALSAGISTTERTYADPDGAPLCRRLSVLSGQRRNAILRDLVRELDSLAHPHATFIVDEANSDVAWRRDGQRVAIRTAQLRWESCTVSHPGRWMARFMRVPLIITPSGSSSASSASAEASSDDELLLALFSPAGVHVVRHDAQHGVARTGGPSARAVRARQVNLYGASGIRGWRASLELFLLPKLEASGCEWRGFAPFEPPHPAWAKLAAAHAEVRAGIEETEAAIVATTAADDDPATGKDDDAKEVTAAYHGRRDDGDGDGARRRVAAAYAGVPLSGLSPSSRRSALLRLVRAIDEEAIHPDAAFADARTITFADARTTRSWRREGGWRRGETTVVCRSAQLLWERSHGRWRVLFSGVPPPPPAPALPPLDVYDRDADEAHEQEAAGGGSDHEQEGGSQSDNDVELLLALYCPSGVHILRHDGRLGLTRTGASTLVSGRQIKLHGPKGEGDWRRALERKILPMVDAAGGCERVAFVEWCDEPQASDSEREAESSALIDDRDQIETHQARP